MAFQKSSRRDDLFALPDLWKPSAFSAFPDREKDDSFREISRGSGPLSHEVNGFN